eukprot:UN00482
MTGTNQVIILICKTLKKILVPKSRVEDITYSNLIWSADANTDYARGSRRISSRKDKHTEMKNQKRDEIKNNFPALCDVINLVSPKIIYLHTHAGRLDLEKSNT